MPISIERTKTPRGHPFLLMRSSGDVTSADAAAMFESIALGTPNDGLAILALVEGGTKYSLAARQAFTKGGNKMVTIRVALVVNSVPLRVILSFIMRMSGASRNTRFFGNEPAALAWLDETLSASSVAA